MITVTINGAACQAREGDTVLQAAQTGGVYIPFICGHPDLPPFHELPLADHVYQGHIRYDSQPADTEVLRGPEGCGLCVVEVDGVPEPVRACHTLVAHGMTVRTESQALMNLRRTHLARIMARHPHACLTCAQREGCSLLDCSSNVPKEERCCNQFHNCELRKVAEHIGIKEETQRYRPAGLPALHDEPLFARDFNLCIHCARCVRACNNLRGIQALGIVHHDGRLVVGSVAPTLAGSGCKFCGACVEVCPTGCLTDQGKPAGDRERWLVPCVGTCPAAVDVPGYIRRIAAGDFTAAAALVWETLPLPNVLGYVCFHLCERECRRGEIDDPIAICALKRFALETADGRWLAKMANSPDSGKRIAVIGGGPAGLAAAYFSRFKGHQVTIFEAAQTPGGMPAQTLPAYRLANEALAKDVDVIAHLGVTIKTGQRLESPDAMTNLLEEGFDAVLIATGLPEPKKIPLEGSRLEGVHWGLEFLRAVKSGQSFDLGRKVVVVGGGNVAVDVAMTALRLSGGRVRMYCLESRDEMPAHAHEVAKAEAEGIEVHPSWGPAAISGRAGHVAAIEFRRCTSVFDAQRNFAPTFDETVRQGVDADAVILAVGQSGPADIPAERDGIFRAGDITGGLMSVVYAVASGRAAAERIDRHLGGNGQITVRLVDHTPPPAWIGRHDGFVPCPRVSIPGPTPEQRCADFRQIEGTYASAEAVAEAKRCLQCDLRLLITQPTLPPEKWHQLCRTAIEAVPALEGVFTLADADRVPTMIKGTENLRVALLEKCDEPGQARYFIWEQDRMFTKRESELIQQHLKRYGELPSGGDSELDGLF